MHTHDKCAHNTDTQKKKNAAKEKRRAIYPVYIFFSYLITAQNKFD